MEEEKVATGLIIGGLTGFILVGAALVPLAMPAVIATSIATLGMIGGASVGGDIAAKMCDKAASNQDKDPRKEMIATKLKNKDGK